MILNKEARAESITGAFEAAQEASDNCIAGAENTPAQSAVLGMQAEGI